MEPGDTVEFNPPLKLTLCPHSQEGQCLRCVAGEIGKAVFVERERCAIAAVSEMENSVSASQSGGEWFRCAEAILSKIRKGK